MTVRKMDSAVEGMEETNLEMSNFDSVIDDGLEELLRQNPNTVCSTHSGWNFNGKVWFDGTVFCEEVWQYHQKVDFVSAPTLRELMHSVNDKYGWK